MPGYPVTILAEEDRAEKFLCTYCNLLLKDPQQSLCGHRFCSSCLNELLEGDGVHTECPICHMEDPSDDSILKVDTIHPDRAIKREMRDLETRCSHPGCKWQGLFNTYETHERSCGYRLIPCARRGCPEQIPSNDMEAHLTDDCIMRVIHCDFCREDVVAKEMQTHLTVCGKVPVNCEYCGQKVIREKIQEHIDIEVGDCPRKMQPCKFHDIGCKTPVEVGKEAEHSAIAFEYHQQLLLQGVCKLRDFGEYIKLNVQQPYHHFNATVQDHDGILTTLRLHLERLENDLSLRSWPTTPAESQLPVEGDIQTVSQMLEKSGRTSSELQNKTGILETKVATYEAVVVTLNEDVEQNADSVQRIKIEEKKFRSTLEALERKTKAQDRIIALKDVALAEQDLRIQSLEMASYGGILTWKISEFGRKRRDSIAGRTLSLYSPYFFTSQFGYKMCARIYLNGDGMGKGNHISLFFVIMKGENDAILRWPFRQKVTFMWIDQNDHEPMIDAFRPDPTSSSFKRPTGDMNIASGCPLFMPLSMLEDGKRAYVKDDTAFLRVIVDTSDL